MTICEHDYRTTPGDATPLQASLILIAFQADFELYSPFAEGAQMTLSSSFACGRDLLYVLYCISTHTTSKSLQVSKMHSSWYESPLRGSVDNEICPSPNMKCFLFTIIYWPVQNSILKTRPLQCLSLFPIPCLGHSALSHYRPKLSISHRLAYRFLYWDGTYWYRFVSRYRFWFIAIYIFRYF